MGGEAREHSQIMAAAGRSLAHQRAGGRRLQPIGQRSRELRRAHLKRKVARLVTAVVAILVAAMGAGLLLNGIGFTGIVLTVLAMVPALFVFARYPRLAVPDQARLNSGDLRTMLGNPELWLEAQRPALPAPAVQIVDQLGGQLDALGLQLEGLDETQPQVAEVRRLVGEYLPEGVSTYTSIPRHLRGQANAGRVPDDDLAQSLGRISAEIDSVSRQIAEGQIDKLAIRTNYLGDRYGGALEDRSTG